MLYAIHVGIGGVLMVISAMWTFRGFVGKTIEPNGISSYGDNEAGKAAGLFAIAGAIMLATA